MLYLNVLCLTDISYFYSSILNRDFYIVRHYSPISFFRNTPNKLLKVYFDKHELLSGIGFDSMKEGNPKQLIAAWADVSEEDKKEIGVSQRRKFSGLF